MIAVHKRHNNGGFDPILVYDGENEEMWGYDPLWKNCQDRVGMDEEAFAAFFAGSFDFVAGKTDEDPFEDVPNAEDLCRNYPPGSEEILDLESPPPPEDYDGKDD